MRLRDLCVGGRDHAKNHYPVPKVSRKISSAIQSALQVPRLALGPRYNVTCVRVAGEALGKMYVGGVHGTVGSSILSLFKILKAKRVGRTEFAFSHKVLY